jgi:hypothetical protein
VISCLCKVFERIIVIFILSLSFCFSCEIGSSSSLVLDGVDLKLVSISINGKELKVHNFYPTFPKSF